jgi:hypothetical protein
MGIGWSIHRNDGWRGQYNRMLRWYERMSSAAAQGSPDTDDFVFAFFQNCYYLREWIAQTSTTSTAELDALFAGSRSLRLCRDLCNGTKHLNISRPSVDAHFSIGREYAPGEPTGHRLFAIADDKYDLLELAAACVKDWEQFASRIGA